MGENREAAADLIRLTFTVDPASQAGITEHLNDLGLDVLDHGEGRITATWDEPDRPIEGLIEELWAIQGNAFEATLEEYRRLGLHTLHHEEDGTVHATDAA